MFYLRVLAALPLSTPTPLLLPRLALSSAAPRAPSACHPLFLFRVLPQLRAMLLSLLRPRPCGQLWPRCAPHAPVRVRARLRRAGRRSRSVSAASQRVSTPCKTSRTCTQTQPLVLTCRPQPQQHRPALLAPAAPQQQAQLQLQCTPLLAPGQARACTKIHRSGWIGDCSRATR